MRTTIKWVVPATAICALLSIVIYLAHQELDANPASASPGPSAVSPSPSAGAKYVNPELLRRPGCHYQYGRIKSLTRKGRTFEMRFDPAFWLSGVSARRSPIAHGSVRWRTKEGH